MTKKKTVKAGKITKEEMKQVKLADKKHGMLERYAPVEAMKGVGSTKGKQLRARGIKTGVGTRKAFEAEAVERQERREKGLRPKKTQLQGVQPLARGIITTNELKQTEKYLDKEGRLKLSAPVEVIKGVGPKKGKALRKEGISTVEAYIKRKRK